jgi:60 kDa SS-A/Ro ribonucleoprotein
LGGDSNGYFDLVLKKHRSGLSPILIDPYKPTTITRVTSLLAFNAKDLSSTLSSPTKGEWCNGKHISKHFLLLLFLGLYRSINERSTLMARFNTASAATHKTTNLAGGDAYKVTPELELVSALLTSFLEDKFYQSGADRQKTITEAFAKVDPHFAAQAAIYARNEFGMRSVSHVVAGEIAGKVKGEQWTKRFFDRVIRRPDDMTEILSYYYANYGKKEPAALRKGFAEALGRFDAYQLAKYRGAKKDVKLVDVVNLVHPKHTDAIAALVKDELRNTKTFESKLSAAGQTGEEGAKGAAWANLVESGEIGQTALLRNLRNILQESPETVKKAIALLTDENRIKKSLILPFQYLTAYEQLENEAGASKLLSGLSKALDISFKNVPKFDGETLIIIDHSGSMGQGQGSLFVKAAMFGIGLARSSDADLMHFGDEAEYLSFNTADSTMTLLRYLDSLNKGGGYYSGRDAGHNVGHGTNFNAPFDEATKAYDRVIIITDMQAWEGKQISPDSPVARYCKRTGAKPYFYAWDISGYGSLQFPENHVAVLAGWSEKVFDIMKFAETDKKALLNTIKGVEL